MLQAQIIAALVAVALAFGTGWKVRAWRADHDDLARVELAAADAAKRAARADGAAHPRY